MSVNTLIGGNRNKPITLAEPTSIKTYILTGAILVMYSSSTPNRCQQVGEAVRDWLVNGKVES